MTSSGSSSANRRPAPGAPRALLLLDTNALLRMGRPGFPWREEISRWLGPTTIGVPAAVLHELRRLEGRQVPGARAAAQLAGRFVIVPSRGRGDQAIAALAESRRATVLTADRLFAEALRGRGIDVLVPRDRSRLELQRGVVPRREGGAGRATVKNRVRLRTVGKPDRRSHARR